VQSAGALDPLVSKGMGCLWKLQQPDGGFRNPRAAGPGAAQLTRVGGSALAGLALLRAGQDFDDKSHGSALLRLAKFVCAGLNDRSTIEMSFGSMINSEYGPGAERSHGIEFLARALPLLSTGEAARDEMEVALKTAVREQAKMTLTLPTAEKHEKRDFGRLPHTNLLLRQIALETAAAVGIPIDAEVIHQTQMALVSEVDQDRGALRKEYLKNSEFHALAAALRSSASAVRGAAELCRPKGAKEARAEHVVRAKLATVVTAENMAFVLEQKACAVKLAKSLPRDPDLFKKNAGGGEHFLAYAHISEALLLLGDQPGYLAWQRRLHSYLERQQNADGSWMGQSCITDPVYSTAASMSALTAQRELPLLRKLGTWFASTACCGLGKAH
jgi:hypothetical protein